MPPNGENEAGKQQQRRRNGADTSLDRTATSARPAKAAGGASAKSIEVQTAALHLKRAGKKKGGTSAKELTGVRHKETLPSQEEKTVAKEKREKVETRLFAFPVHLFLPSMFLFTCFYRFALISSSLTCFHRSALSFVSSVRRKCVPFAKRR